MLTPFLASAQDAAPATPAAQAPTTTAAPTTGAAAQATPAPVSSATTTVAPANGAAAPAGQQPAAPAAADAPLKKVSFTQVQADRGKTEYKRSCLDCHGANLDDGEFGGAPLKGSSFQQKWFGITADALYGFMSTAMPPDRPGRLSPQVYADLTAYILSRNGVQPGAAELPADLDKLATLTIE